MKKRIWLSSPDMAGHEINYVTDAVSRNHVFPLGEYVNKFEEKICEYSNVKYCVALSSGTSAIHLALISLNISQGDEVICSSYTFSASANPILYLKAIPILIDSELDTWNMCPVLLEKAIKDRIKKTKKKPKAIILVHLYGMPAKMKEIISVANKYNIPIIEDAAEALGSKFKNQQLGTFGEIGIFSFNGNKIITTSGGGALISGNKKHVKLSLKRATQSREAVKHYEHKEIGYNYRLSNISAAIGLGQMEILDDRVKKRRKVYNKYFNSLRKYKNFKFLNEPNQDYVSNRWLTTLTLKDIDVNKLIEYLEGFKIESRNLWKPLHLQPVFKNFPSYTNGISKNLFENGICLPSSSNITNEEQDFVIKKLINFIK